MRFILLLTFISISNLALAYKPGIDIIRESPVCKSQIIQKTTSSGNTCRARFWTDGKMNAPMLPYRPWLVKCPKCGVLFWIDEAKKLGQQNPLEKQKAWPKAQKVKLPNEKEILDFISSSQLSDKKEFYARRRAWWLANDETRENSTRTHKFVAGQKDNLKALMNLLDEKKPNQRIMKAEIFRELGQFSECIKLLDKPFSKKHHSKISGFIMKLAKQKSTKLHEITNVLNSKN